MGIMPVSYREMLKVLEFGSLATGQTRTKEPFYIH